MSAPANSSPTKGNTHFAQATSKTEQLIQTIADDQQGEFNRALKGLDAMQIEDELFLSLDGAVSVFKGREKHSLVYVNVTRVTKASVDERTLTDIVNEVRTLGRLSHDYIVQHLAWYQTARHVWIVSEMCSGGSLREVLIHHSLETETVKDIARDVGSALRYLHSDRSVVHGDLRPENLLLTENGVVKLTGFKIADWLDQPSTPALESRLREHLAQHVDYAAPELIRACIENTAPPRLAYAADSWTFGVTLYECVIGSTPFANTSLQHLSERILEDEPRYCREGSSKEFSLAPFIKLLLRKDPKMRLIGDDLGTVISTL